CGCCFDDGKFTGCGRSSGSRMVKSKYRFKANPTEKIESLMMISNHAPLISLTHCSVKLGDQWTLDEINFELKAGERWVLLGENGAGKSVLLKLLRGDMWPTPTGG